ncbi:sodium:calcium antiporter [Phenylobacterium sp.]|jgi:cation:H+ antiporter|uniref:sodium:calcium antiporter n=1 Tax=Phenylobacterium sp. TaxID=1871053 RepID=UPI002E37DC79|nr:sodium:calcium antiporter [Phenylobacterium sp.]HEX3366944.1 sodium:calcium antiporter [Phenylobacterium sp.]
MNSLILPVILLLVSAAVIYLACEVFVNGVEWVGRRFAVGEQATGSILAAFGTALPESVVTFVAVVFGATAAQKQIGVGAALGGPLVLSTIAYATVGIILILCRTQLPKTAAIRSDFRNLSRDQGWFLVIFAAKIALGLVAFAFKPWLGVLFLAAYGAYFWKEMRGSSDIEEEELEPLKLMPHTAEPPTWAAVVQTAVALVVIFGASHLFVKQLDVLGPALGIKPQLLALLLSPIATELPETLNAIIWVRQGKHRLALANISGAMMIQATVPTAFGLFFTPWILDPSLLIGAGVTALAVAAMFIAFRRGFISRVFLTAMAGFYVLFAAIIVAFRLG